MSLKEKIMLVNLNISQWSARKYDSKASREVTIAHSASQNAGRFNKMLIDNDELKEISKAANAARIFHYENTLPWSDDGGRILPAVHYFNYVAEMSKIQNEFNEAVTNFLYEYPSLRNEAYRYLGSLYNEADYPDEDAIKYKFRIKSTFMPIADETDFRIAMSDEEVAEIKNNISSELNNRIQTALNDILERARQAVSHMAETLADPDRKYKDSLIGNIKSLVESIPILNFNNDKHINDVCELLRTLGDYDPETLRWKLTLRKEVAEKAKRILEQI